MTRLFVLIFAIISFIASCGSSEKKNKYEKSYSISLCKDLNQPIKLCSKTDVEPAYHLSETEHQYIETEFSPVILERGTKEIYATVHWKALSETIEHVELVLKNGNTVVGQSEKIPVRIGSIASYPIKIDTTLVPENSFLTFEVKFVSAGGFSVDHYGINTK